MRRYLTLVFFIFAALAPLAARADGMPFQQSQTTHPFIIGPLVCASDHTTNLTGAVLTVSLSKDGAAFGAAGGSVAEVGKGRYAFTPTSSDDGTVGTLSFDVTASLANPGTAPNAPTSTSTGGSIAAGSVLWLEYSWITNAGETQVSSSVSYTVPAGTNTNTVTVSTSAALPVGATGSNWYYSATSGGSFIRCGSSSTNSLTFATIPSGTAAAPTTNTAVASDPWDKDYQIVAYNPLAAPSISNVATVGGQAPPANWSAENIDVSGRVLLQPTQTGVTIPTVTTVGSVTGNVGGSVIGTVSATGSVSAPVTVGGYSGGQDPATLVLDVAASSHDTANTIGAKINAAGSAGDPWQTLTANETTAGSFGKLLGSIQLDGSNNVKSAPQTTVAANVIQVAGQTASASAPVTFPASIGTSTYAGADTSGTTTLLARLGQPVLFDVSGFVKSDPQTLANTTAPSWYAAAPTASAIATAVWGYTIDGTLTASQWGELSLAQGFGAYTVTYGSGTQTSVYKNHAGTTVDTSVISTNGSGQPTSRTTTLSP